MDIFLKMRLFTLKNFQLLLFAVTIAIIIISCSERNLNESKGLIEHKKIPAAVVSKSDVLNQNNTPNSVYEFKMKNIDGKEISLSEYKNKVIIAINVASKCGYTGQYEEIEAFYRSQKDKGIVVLGFPANNFMSQEPGTDAEIKTFCTSKYNVTFPMFSKISVKGSDKHPLYKYITSKLGENIKWNFNKVIIDKNGIPVKHFGSGVKVNDRIFLDEIERLIQ